MVTVLIQATGIWLAFVGIAILNGAVREKLLGPLIGRQLALPLSGIFLSFLIFLITLLLVPALEISAAWQYWLVGGMWLILTVAFEFIFGRYVMGESWNKLFESYNVLTGSLWVLVLLTTAVSPYLAARLRGLV